MKPIQTTILAASIDADLLGATHALLTAMDYQVTCTSLTNQLAALTRLHRPDVVIVDAREENFSSGQLRDLNAVANVLGTRVMVWHDEAANATFAEFIDAGVDDIVDPSAWGELLSRLQSVARLREFEARLAEQSGLDPITGLLTQEVFQEVLQARWETGDLSGCLHVALDHLVSHQRHLGTDAFQQMMATATEVFQNSSPLPVAVCGDGAGSYQVLLPADVDCHRTAESIRAAFEQISLQVIGGLPLTISCGICLKDDANSSDELLHGALESAKLANHRGGNCVANDEQRRIFDAQWQQLSDPEMLFAATTAKHLLTPFAWQLRHDDSLRRAASLFEQTALEHLPVFDDNGFVGLLQRDQACDDLGRHVSEVCSTSFPQADLETSFQEVLETFINGGTHLVVVNNSQAVGMIRAEDLAAMDQLPLRQNVDESLVGTDRLVIG